MSDLNAVVLLVVTFAGVLFLLFKEPHWLIVSARIFSRGVQAPAWLVTVERWLKRKDLVLQI